MQLVQKLQICSIQFRPFAVADHIGIAFLLNAYPQRLCHLVEDTSNAPLHGGALHGIRQSALDRLDVGILRAVPFGDEAFSLNIDGNAAELRVLLSVSVPRLVVIVPVFRSNDLVQTILNGAVRDIRNGKTADLVL